MKKLIAVALLSTVPMFAWNPFKGKSGYAISVVALATANAMDFGPKTLNLPGFTATFTDQREYRPAVKGASLGAVVVELIALRKHPEWQGRFTAANWAGAAGVGVLAAVDQRK